MIGIGGWRGRNADSGPMWYIKDGKLVSDPTPGNAGSHGARLPYAMTNQVPEPSDAEGPAEGLDARRRRVVRRRCAVRGRT